MTRLETKGYRPAKVAPSPRRVDRGDDGFSLIELLVTMLIVTVVLLGTAALQISVVRNVTDSKRTGEATRLAQRVLARYKSTNFAGLVPTAGVWVDEIQRQGVSTMKNVSADGEGVGPYSVRHIIETTPSGRLVTVEVRWLGVTNQNPNDPANEGRVTVSMERYP